MKLPSATNSAELLHATYGVYHQTRLEADKQKELADAFAQAQTRLKAKIEAYEAARVATMKAQAIRDGEDEVFDNAVRAFSLALRAKVGNSSKAPLYRKYFEDGLGATIGAPLDQELQRASILLAKLADEEDESLRAYAGTITSAMNALGQAMDAHRAAMDSEAQAWGMLETEKVNWMDAYKRSYRELTRIYFKEPKRADAYFKATAKAKKGNGGNEPAPPAAAN